MAEQLKNGRITSIDFMRGLTVAFIIFVNSPGSWDYVYPWFAHAKWNGCTPTDLVFPFFLFIVGLSVYFSNTSTKEQAEFKIICRFLKRAIQLFFIGLLINGFPFYHLSTLRIPGVLQRISIVFLVCSFLNRYTSRSFQFILILVLLVGYWVLICFTKPPGMYTLNPEPTTNLSAWVDGYLLKNHVWTQTKPWDPEGVLSTLPAIASGLIGVLTASSLQQVREKKRSIYELPIIGILLILLGICWNNIFPINKNLWSSSYVLYTSGIAQFVLWISYRVIDEQGYKNITKPFLAFGNNAITAYIISEVLEASWNVIQLKESYSLKVWVFDHCFASWLSPYWASHLMAFVFTGIIYLPIYWMYKRRIFIKIG